MSRMERNRDLILRIPRWGTGNTERTVSTAEYVRQHSSIPVAATIAKDCSRDNALESPYILQSRLSGQDLENLWGNLDHLQRCTIAREIGSTMKSLLALESFVTGYIMPSNGKGDEKPHKVIPFGCKNDNGDDWEELYLDKVADLSESEKETPLEFFGSQIGRWRAIDLHRNAGAIDDMVILWDKMRGIVDQMGEMGLFTSDLHCLCHTDLFSRNIMAEIRLDRSVRVSGILDWDDAMFGPKFVCCKPPGWLWGFESDDLPTNSFPFWPYEIPGAKALPSRPEQQELKRVFEEYAGLEYNCLAYKEEYRICRVLFHVTLFGLTSSENLDAAERVVSDWEQFCKSQSI